MEYYKINKESKQYKKYLEMKEGFAKEVKETYEYAKELGADGIFQSEYECFGVAFKEETKIDTKFWKKEGEFEKCYVPRKKKFRDRIVKLFDNSPAKDKLAFGAEEWSICYLHAFGKEEFVILSSMDKIEGLEAVSKEYTVEVLERNGQTVREEEVQDD